MEESLLKQAQDESIKKENFEEETEIERLAELRRKGRGKGCVKLSLHSNKTKLLSTDVSFNIFNCVKYLNAFF